MYKHFLRMCSLLLTLAMLISMLPTGILAEELQATQSGTLDSTQSSDEDVHIVAEITDKRTEYSKEYLLSNGLHMATVYTHAVHYEKNGQWTDIDNTLRTVGTDSQTTYANTAGVWDVSFPQQLSTDKGVSITKDGYTLTFYMSGELRSSSGGNLSTSQMDAGTASFAMTEAAVATAEIQNIDLSKSKAEAEHPETIQEELHSRLQYADVFADTNIVYDLTSNQLKESIVMERYSSTLQGYQYTLNTGGMTPVLGEDGQIQLFGEDSKEPVMVMPAPYLLDSADDFCGDVTVELVEKGEQYILLYLLPQEWLADEERQWPVILDPVVSATASVTNIKDQCVFSDGTSDPQSTVLDCGYGGYGTGAMRIYLQYVELPELTSADVIVDAVVQLYKVYDYGHTDPISVHKVLDTWDSMTMQWSNKADHDPIVQDFAVCKDVGYYQWNVTDIVRGWYKGENTGMMFKNTDDVETNSTYYHYQRFRSSDYSIYDTVTKPTLSIVFRNNNGLESYWDYTSASAGRAGTGYVNNYTGNLVWIRGDLGFGGCVMPVSISHVYNANDSANNTFGLGNGWRTNYNQQVYQWTHPNAATTYYVWEDSDGTAHYFLYDTEAAAYVDEDGLELKLTIEDDGTYTLQDKNGNTSYFDTSGRLTKQENNQSTKSSINITYVSTSNRISTITDSAGRVYAFTYNSSNLLTKIEYKGSGSTALTQVTFGYSGAKLTSITDEDGKVSTYTYAANTNDTSKNLIETAKDIDGYTLTYTYTSHAAGQPARVASVTETYGTTAGGSLTIEYAKNQTTFTDHNENVQIMQFNNLGNTVSVQDDQGRAQYAQYALSDAPDPTDTAAETAGTEKANQLTLSSKLQNTVGNVLTEGSFEVGGLWTATSSAVTVSRASGTAYMGSKSMKLVRSASGTAAGAYSGSFSVAAGETYTFSAWVKTGTGSAYLALHDGSTTVTSEVLAKNQGWTRLQVSYTATAAKTLTARILTAEAGTLYVDCVQVEKALTASRYNLIENGDFRGTNGWSASAGRTTLTAAAPELSTNVYTMTGVYNATNRLSQTVNVSGAANDVFVLAGWAKGDSVPLDSYDTNPREFSLIATFNNTDGTTSTSKIRFNPYTDSSVNWQYAAAPIVAAKAYSSITVELAYDYNMNTVHFDGIQLFKEEFGSSYTYDENGNVKSVTDIQGEKTTYEYKNNNLTKAILPTGAELTYTYDSYHNVKTATTATGVVYSFGYDSKGNNTSVSITSGGVTLTSTAEYSGTGLLLSTTDAAGNKTQYGYNANTNVLEWVKYPKDTDATRTNYTYDDMYRIATAAATTDSGAAMSAAYTYTNDLLTKIATPTTTYNFNYGSFGLRSNIQVGTQALATYTYTTDKNFYLEKLAYGNSDSVQYTYDDHGRVTKQTYEDGDTVSYQYDNSGALATVTDSATGIKTTYYYDFADRLMKYVESGTGYSHSVGYAYDEINNLTSLVETINGTAHTTSYTYDDDNRVTTVTNGSASTAYTYDGYSRVSKKVTKNGTATVLTDTFTYRTPTTGTTSGQVSTLKLAASGYNVTYSYTYDKNGNILSVSDGTNTTSYVYDSAGQLLRENNQAAGKTWVWTYDDAGNIKTRKEYAYTTGTLGTVVDTVDYGYTIDNWGDLLTSYDGQTITYDEIGNPESDGTWEYTWEHGRQLASMTDGSTTWTYTYNADGLRTQRTNGTTTYNYIYNGSSLTQMTVGSDTLYFAYDGSSPMSVTYNGTNYYYATNLQGDVIAILNSSGTAVVEYTYDAWGKLLTTTGSMASTLGAINPLTYRGYVFDRETGLYYLQSRYYNPEIGRFINADILVNTGQGFIGNNMFAYCNNNPVMGYDPTGTLDWGTLFEGASLLTIGLTACLAAVTVVSGGACAPLFAAAVVTFMAGGMTVLNGAAEVIESTTDYNFMRDGLYGGNEQFYENQKVVYSTIAEVGTAIISAGSQNPDLCFVAGTMILAAEGTKAIETVEAGDFVWAWNEETGEVALKEVVETYVNETDELVHVFVNGEEIIATPSHPFYSPVKGWTAAVHLRAGDILVLVNGDYVVVEKIQHEILETPVTVYNFQVADFHTYYVANSGVLVHNSCNHNGKWNNERRRYWREQGKEAILDMDYGAYTATDENIDRMKRGLAPIGWDDKSVQLHHWLGIAVDFYNYSPVSQTLHQLIHSLK